MAKGTVNKVILLGRLGADPEVRYMPSGSAVANLRLATNDGYKDKQTGQYNESTEWHRVVLFGRLAEIAGEYLRKGRMAYVEGRIRTNKWQDQSGQDRYTTEVVASELQLLGGQSDTGSTGGNGGFERSKESFSQRAQQKPAMQQAPKANTGYSNNQSAPARPQAKKETAPATPEFANFAQDFDDDIPF